MATIVLRSVGQAVAGPIGAFVGTVVGGAIDSQILSSPRRGPRLNDLSVQDSAYGAMVPKVFGKMRVAGSLIWATELEESEQVSGAKGQPAQQSYSYSANFAVLLSSRPAVRVERIWADGKLLRGASGDFKVPCTFRFHGGDDDQAVDPLIAAIETATPAYRGRAVAVFEGLELAEYGNRIPMLTFELVSQDTAPTVSDLLDELSGGTVNSGKQDSVAGYAAYGTSRASAVEPLLQLYDVRLAAQSGFLIDNDQGQLIELSDQDLGTSDDEREAKIERWSEAEHLLPSQLSIDHYDPDRDYQVGRATAQSGYGQREQTINVPIVLDSEAARGAAVSKIAKAFRERGRLDLRLPPDHGHLRPGQRVTVEGVAGIWRCIDVRVESFVTQLILVPEGDSLPQLPSDGGRLLGPPDVVAAQTQVALFDPPDFGQGPIAGLILAAANANDGWRAVPTEISIGSQPDEGFTAARETYLGFAENALGEATGLLVDDHNSVDIQLVDHHQELLSLNDEDLFAGANLAMLGDELLQFGRADYLGNGRYRLSHLLRGLRGSEWATAGHQAGDAFAVVAQDRTAFVAVDQSQLGLTVAVKPNGIADENAVAATRIATGEALRPPSPVHLRATIIGDGSIFVEWTRRSRAGFAWLDGSEVPMGENVEGYGIDFIGADTRISIDSIVSQCLLESADVTALGSGALTIEVRMKGERALSRPASIQLTI